MPSPLHVPCCAARLEKLPHMNKDFSFCDTRLSFYWPIGRGAAPFLLTTFNGVLDFAVMMMTLTLTRPAVYIIHGIHRALRV